MVSTETEPCEITVGSPYTYMLHYLHSSNVLALEGCRDGSPVRTVAVRPKHMSNALRQFPKPENYKKHETWHLMPCICYIVSLQY